MVLWSLERSFKLARPLQDYGSKHQTTVLEASLCSSISDAVSLLNEGTVSCPPGICVAYSASATAYYVLYQNGKKHIAFETFGVCEAWSLEQCLRLSEHFRGQIPSSLAEAALDVAESVPVATTVASLRVGIIDCPEGFCVLISKGSYLLLYRQDMEHEARDAVVKAYEAETADEQWHVLGSPHAHHPVESPCSMLAETKLKASQSFEAQLKAWMVFEDDDASCSGKGDDKSSKTRFDNDEGGCGAASHQWNMLTSQDLAHTKNTAQRGCSTEAKDSLAQWFVFSSVDDDCSTGVSSCSGVADEHLGNPIYQKRGVVDSTVLCKSMRSTVQCESQSDEAASKSEPNCESRPVCEQRTSLAVEAGSASGNKNNGSFLKGVDCRSFTPDRNSASIVDPSLSGYRAELESALRRWEAFAPTSCSASQVAGNQTSAAMADEKYASGPLIEPSGKDPSTQDISGRDVSDEPIRAYSAELSVALKQWDVFAEPANPTPCTN